MIRKFLILSLLLIMPTVSNAEFGIGAFSDHEVSSLKPPASITVVNPEDVGLTIKGAFVTVPRGADPCGDTAQFPRGAQFNHSSTGEPCYCDNNGDDLSVVDGSACY